MYGITIVVSKFSYATVIWVEPPAIADPTVSELGFLQMQIQSLGDGEHSFCADKLDLRRGRGNEGCPNEFFLHPKKECQW